MSTKSEQPDMVQSDSVSRQDFGRFQKELFVFLMPIVALLNLPESLPKVFITGLLLVGLIGWAWRGFR